MRTCRCFAFFHPRMPNEPLIFVEVALVNRDCGQYPRTCWTSRRRSWIPTGSIRRSFIPFQRPGGLAGISFGSFLIKRVVDVLADEFRNLKLFVLTLSPIPGFCSWLNGRLKAPVEEAESKLLIASERKACTPGLDSGKRNHQRTCWSRPDWHKKAESPKAPEGA